jgi:spore germination protein GerM
MMRRSSIALITSVTVVVSACGVQGDASPRDLPDDEQELNIADPVDPDASGANRVYLIAPGEERLLRSVQREATSAFDLIQILLQGPTDSEVQEQYDTAIPSTTELLGTGTQGQVLTVNLTTDIDELDSQTLMHAVAQIVYTATELPTVEAVQIEIDGEPLSAPTPDGDTKSGPVRVYDYPTFVQSSQPAFPAAALTSG